jgi:ferritin-like metal-binding protein YciE
MRLDCFDDLFLEQIKDLYDAEQRLIKALPKMAETAHNADLRAGFESHLHETEGQARRLERIFQLLGKEAESKTCYAMKGLIEEGEEVIDATGDPDVKDAALIAAAQRVEHYEIAGYGSAHTFAERLGMPEAARLLQETLQEEKEADRKLTQIAESHINAQAQTA